MSLSCVDSDVGASPVKRRKVDNDGFVTPATPDIPVTSQFHKREVGMGIVTGGDFDAACRYLAKSSETAQYFHSDDDYLREESEHNEAQHTEYNNSCVDNRNDEISVSQSEFSVSQSDISGSQSEAVGGQSEAVGGQSEAVGGQSETAEDDSGSTASSGADHMPLVNVIKTLVYKVKGVNEEWADAFRDAERREELLPSRIDSLLQQALLLEQQLTQQKQALVSRVKQLLSALNAQ